jgi:hypothetical protein
MDFVQKREFSDEKRKELADKGHAMQDGSFPIENITDLHNAIQSVGRSSNYAKAKAHIIARAKDLEATNILPEDWKVKKFIDDVKNAFEKAIGTSSSVDQERDERTVENYVRQTGNVNVPPVNVGDYTIGGNQMANNTTEPDPKGDIAVQKDLPAANQPASTDLINQNTRPYGDVTVSDAPNQTPDVSTGGAGIYKSGMTCPDCKEAVMHLCNMDKADDSDEDDKVEKADVCADCGKSTAECGCTKKAASSDEITEDNDDDETVEKAVSSEEDPKISKVWKGAFSPFNKL